MTLPNREAGLTPGTLFATSFPAGTSYNLLDPQAFNGLTDRLNWRTQPNVVEFLKSRVRSMQEWGASTNAVFEGMRRGVPGGENVPLPLAIVELFASQLLGVPLGTWATVNDAVAAIEAMPGIKQFIEILTQAPGVIGDYEEMLWTWASNLNSIFNASMNLLDPAFDAGEAILDWVITNVLPVIIDAIEDAAVNFDYLVNSLVPGFIGGTISDFGDALGNLGALLGNPNLLPPGTFNPVTAAGGLINDVLEPTGLIPILTGGYLSDLQIPGLDASKIITGFMDLARLPASVLTDLSDIAASAIIGVLTDGNIPGLDLSKIVSGFGTGIASWLAAGTALPSGVSLAGSQLTGTINMAISNASTIGGISLATLLGNINSSGQLLASGVTGFLNATTNIPGLDLAKITTGFGAGIAAWLAAGTALPGAVSLAGGQLTGSVAASLVSGFLNATTNIPALDLSKITSGFGTGIAAWLAAGSALPSGVSLAGSQLTGAVAGSIISGVTAIEQAIIDAVNAAVGVASGGLAGTIQTALQNFPPVNVIGTFASGLAASLGIPTSLDGLNSALGGIAGLLGYRAGAPPVTSTTGITTTNNTFMAALGATRPSSQAIDPTADTTFAISQIVGSSATTIPVTQAVSAMGAIGIQYGGIDGVSTSLWPSKKAICWLGSGPTTTTITGMWLNIWRINTLNGTAEIVHASPELIGTQGVSTTLAWNYYPSTPNAAITPIPVEQGDWFCAEMCVMGSGTYNIVGMPSNWIPAHPTVYPKAIGATRKPMGLDASIPNTGANGANNNTKSGASTIVITPTIDPNATCVTVISAVALASAAVTPAWSMKIGAANVNIPQAAVRQVSTPAATAWIYAYVLFFTDPANGNKPCRAADIGLSGAQNVTLTQSNASLGTWNASLGCQSFIGPTSLGTPVTNSGTGSTLTATVPAARKSLVLLGAAGANTFANTSANWVPGGSASVNLGGTFPMLAGYGLGPTTSSAFTALLNSSTTWGMIAIPLLIDAATSTALAKLPVPGAIGAGGNTVQYSSNIPWLGLTGTAGTSQHPDQVDIITTLGSSSYNIPVWANNVYAVVFAGGGGGSGGTAFPNQFGNGGGPGGSAVASMNAAQIAASGGTISVFVGGGGGGGPGATGGAGGAGSGVAATGWAGVSASGGYGGNSFGAPNGIGATGQTANGTFYPGSATVGAGTPGAFPGGGGGGGSWSGFTPLPGTGGAQGVVYIIATQ